MSYREPLDGPTPREWAEALLLRQRMGLDAPGAVGEPPAPTPEEGSAEPPPGLVREPPPADDGPAEVTGPSARQAAEEVDPPERTPSGEPVRPGPPVAPVPSSLPVALTAEQAAREHGGLRDPLGLGRALRPFGRRWYHSRKRALDEEETAVRSAELGHWDPVLREIADDWLDVALVVEHSASMLLWRDLARSLAELLRNQGAFRDVRVWRLDTWESKEAALYAERGTTARDPAELLHPEHRRLVLVLSDCAGDSWVSGALPRMLLTWARHQPVAVLNPLPSRLWNDTEAAPVDVHLRAAAAGLPNARLAMRGGAPRAGAGPETATGPGADTAPVPVPVLEIQPDWLAGWARMVAGAATGWTPASVLLVDRDGLRMPWPAQHRVAAQPGTAAELVRRFVKGASPAAQRLATRLAMVPLTLRVMQAERAALLPGAGPLPLAEIMLGGLLEQVGPAAGAASADRNGERGPAFEFIQGVRAHLLGGLGRTEIFRALPAASAVAARVLGARDDLVGRLLGAPDELHGAGLSPSDRRLVGAMQPALAALGVAYTPMAERALTVARAEDPGDRRQNRPARAAASAASASERLSGVEPMDHTPSDTDSPAPARGAAAGAGLSTGAAPEETPATAGAAAPAAPSEAADAGPGGSSPSGPGSPAQPGSATGDVPDPGRVPRPGAYFTGREEELRQLAAALTEGERAALLPQALYGLGGVGKTQLALEYVRRHAGDYDMVWWVQAEQPAVIRGSLTALAPRLGIQDTEARGVVDRVIAALESGRPVKRWLLVFDNAGAPDEVERFLPYMTGVPGGLGHVIVTSRNSGWADSVPSLRVDVFARDESVDFLRRRARGITVAEAGRMAVALGDLPLALEQAAAMKVKSGLSADEYLDLLETQGPQVREENASTAHGTQSVSAVWQVSMRDLQARSPGALELLRLLAFFGPDPVQQSFLHDARLLGFPEPLASLLRDRIARGRAISETGRYSLLTTDVGTVQLHRLLRSVLQDELDAQEAAEMRYRVHQVLVAHDPGDPQVGGNWEKYQDLLPHIRPSGMLESDDQEARWTVLNVVRYLFFRGDFQSSVELGREIVRTWTASLGEDHLQTLGATRRLAAALWQLGSYDEARELNQTTLERLRRTVGEDHEDSLALAGLVAADLRAAGSFREALEYDQNVFEHSVRLYGRDDAASLTAGHNYAVSLRMSGRFSEAYELDRRNGEVYTRSLGPSSQWTLLAVNNVARDLRELGRYADSVRLQEQTVAQYRQRYGETHPDTLRAVKNLSVSYRKAGDRDRALALARAVLANYREVLGENHMDTLAALTNLANDLRLKGDAQGAREAGADALARYRSVLGAAHPFTYIAAVNQAAALRASGEFPEARRMDEETVAGMAASLWEEHVWLQIARINLATGVAAAGDPAAAAVIGAEAVRHLESQYGDSHPHTLTALRNLALDLEQAGDPDGSEDLLAKVRRRYRATLGDLHPETRNALAGVRAEGDLEPPPI